MIKSGCSVTAVYPVWNMYSIDGFEDYYYGYMVPDTGYLKYFDLKRYQYGFVLLLPTMGKPKELPEFVPQDKLFATLAESARWGRGTDLETVGALNDTIAAGGMAHLILIQEALQEKKIAEIAAQIAEKKTAEICYDRRPVLFWKDHLFPSFVYSA